MLKVIRQSEAAECGIVALCIVANFYGLKSDPRAFRHRFSTSLKGVTLSDLIQCALKIGLSGRALRCDPHELTKLRRPCILHWDLNHFVVLEKVHRNSCVVVDPAVGRRRVSAVEICRSFTGVALELSPNATFKRQDERQKLKLSELTGSLVFFKRTLGSILVIAGALECLSLLSPLVTQLIIDDALVTADQDILLLAVLGGAALALVEFILRVSRGVIGLRVSQHLSVSWTANLFAHLLTLPADFFAKRLLGDITSRFASLGSILATVTGGAISVVLDGLMSIITLGLMLVYSKLLTFVAILALLLYGLVRVVAYAPLRDASLDRLLLSAKENSYFLESIRSVVTLKLNGRLADRLARWRNLAVDVQNRDTRTQRLSLLFAALNTLISSGEAMTLLYLGGEGVIARTMTLGMLLAFLSYKTQFGDRASKLVDLAISVKLLSIHSDRLADIALQAPEGAAETSQGEPGSGGIFVSQLSFAYGDREQYVLKDLSFDVRDGESVVVLGQSGCGKTTLVKLLLRLIEPTEGSIRIGTGRDTVSIANMELAAYRGMIGAVMQDDVLLAGSIAENIACFDSQPVYERIEECARIACIYDDIARMPMGFHTLVSEMGSTLSGGQKQRVMLARALYKRPRILLLDEGTSQLDSITEQRILESLSSQKCTKVYVTHSLSARRFADRQIEISTTALENTSGPAFLAEPPDVMHRNDARG